MITAASQTGVIIPPSVLDVRGAVEGAVAKLVPPGRTKALVGVGRMEGKDFVGELAWAQKVGHAWTITAGLSASTKKKVSGQIMLAGSW